CGARRQRVRDEHGCPRIQRCHPRHRFSPPAEGPLTREVMADMKPDVLLTGATGYIGGRLLRHFEEAGRAVRCVARQPEKITPGRLTTEVVQGDCFDEASLVRAFADVQSAYYLVHSMAAGSQFAELD